MARLGGDGDRRDGWVGAGPNALTGRRALAWAPAWFGVERVEQREKIERDG
jgi:hypothetical protein